MKITCLAVVIALGGAACSQEAPVARHSVEQYRAEKALRQAVIGNCGNDPGTLGATPDCINAREAERLESTGRLRDSGPVGLDPKKKS